MSAYLVRLMDVHERHCGIEKPQVIAHGDNPPGVLFDFTDMHHTHWVMYQTPICNLDWVLSKSTGT